MLEELMLYVFVDESTGNRVTIQAESHPEAIDVAYELMSEPAFRYAVGDLSEIKDPLDIERIIVKAMIRS